MRGAINQRINFCKPNYRNDLAAEFGVAEETAQDKAKFGFQASFSSASAQRSLYSDVCQTLQAHLLVCGGLGPGQTRQGAKG